VEHYSILVASKSFCNSVSLHDALQSAIKNKCGCAVAVLLTLEQHEPLPDTLFIDAINTRNVDIVRLVVEKGGV
jgi:hypothetical protein